MSNSETIYNSIDTYHITPDYDCKICFVEHDRFIELILNFFGYINTGLLDNGNISLKQRFSFYLTKPIEYTIQGTASNFLTISSVKAQRIDIINYDWDRHGNSIRGVRLWIACHINNWDIIQAFNGQIGRDQHIALSAEWLPLQNNHIQQIRNSASTGAVDLTIPSHGLFAIRLHKIKSKKPLEIIETPYLFDKPNMLYALGIMSSI